jgi:hypothetical protein
MTSRYLRNVALVINSGQVLRRNVLHAHAPPSWHFDVCNRLSRGFDRLGPACLEVLTLDAEISSRFDVIVYDKLMDAFEAALRDYATVVTELPAASVKPEQIRTVVKALGALEDAAYQLVPELDRKQRRGGNPWALHILFETTRKPEPPDTVLGYALGMFINIGTLALVEARALGQLIEADGDTKQESMDVAARSRLLRARRRRGVALRARVDLYADELELLQQFGFLAGASKRDPVARDRDAVETALELFLFNSFLSRQEPQVIWRSRWQAEQARRNVIAETPADDELEAPND